jgi:hypothetical protein
MLRVFNARPMQQPMGIEGVVDAATPVRVELKAYLRTALNDDCAGLGLLLRGGAILFCQMLRNVLAAWFHLWVQLKRLKVHDGRHLRA